MLTSALLLVALSTAAQDGKPWEVVTSKDGNFTVEMPARPNRQSSRSSSGPGGKSKTTEIGCKTGNGEYVVFRIEESTPVVKGAEQKVLDATRDSFAQQFNGKVTSDKRVSLEGRPGRDFAVRAQPDAASGVVTIRAREYIDGKSIYVLLAVSAPNRELSEDAGKFLGSFAFGIKSGGTTVKADPRETEATGEAIEGFGMAIDPGHDCKIKPAGKGSLTMEIPAAWHDLNADAGKFNSPRVVQDVDADFVAIVQVGGEFKPVGPSTKPKTFPLVGAGLFLWRDAENYVFLQRTAMIGKTNKLGYLVMFEEREGGHRGASHGLAVPAAASYLRLERKGGRINGAVSEDGVDWKALKPIDTTWAEGKIKVGMVAVTTSSGPHDVKFDNYSLKAK